MQGLAAGAEARRAAPGSGPQQRRQAPRRFAAGARQAVGVGGRGQHLVGGVQADDRYRAAAVENPRRGVRVGEDIEFRRRRDVAARA